MFPGARLLPENWFPFSEISQASRTPQREAAWRAPQLVLIRINNIGDCKNLKMRASVVSITPYSH
jgi:hypothetical protein